MKLTPNSQQGRSREGGGGGRAGELEGIFVAICAFPTSRGDDVIPIDCATGFDHAPQIEIISFPQNFLGKCVHLRCMCLHVVGGDCV
jgi:hypothetical protein